MTDSLPAHWPTRAVAALILSLAAVGIWAPQLGPGVLWVVPVLAFSLMLVVGAIDPRSTAERVAIIAAPLVWLGMAFLLAGQSLAVVNVLDPFNALGELVGGIASLLRGSGNGLALATWLGLSGASWIVGAWYARTDGRGAMAAAFVFLSLPFLSAFAVSRTQDAGWYGGALLAAALLWATRGTLRSTLASAFTVALIGTLAAAVIGPTERQLPQRTAMLPTGGPGGIGDVNPGGQSGEGQQPGDEQAGDDEQAAGDGTPQEARTSILETESSYDTISDSDEDAGVDLEIRAAEPALWRLVVLDRWDGRGWSIGEASRVLPQPALRRTRLEVTARGLSEARVLGAGRVIRARGATPARPAAGESLAFAAPVAPGASYVSLSERVPADLTALAQVPRPAAADYLAETTIWPTLPATVPLSERIDQLPRSVDDSGWGAVFRTARSLSDGEVSQLAVVQNVLTYLRSPANFTYSLRIPKRSPQPLVTFLTDTRVGYCQHFAGAAALLLRLAGVPARVALGFGTGTPRGDGFEVRSSDAHAWTEVYFEGYGWVPFDPTPPESGVQIAAGVDPTAPPREAQRGAIDPRTAVLIVLAVLALLKLAAVVRRLRARRGLGDPLEDLLPRVVPGSAGPSTTLGAIAADLERIGPATAALGRDVERARFAPGAADAVGRDRRPRWRLWRALTRDVGPFRATRLLLFGAPHGHAGTDGRVVTAGTPASLSDSASVAPPPGAAR